MNSEKQKMTAQPPERIDFESHQIDLFQRFVGNPKDIDKLSNTFDLWDSVPR